MKLRERLMRILFRAEYDELHIARVRVQLLEAEAAETRQLLRDFLCRSPAELRQMLNRALRADLKRARFDRYVAMSPEAMAETLAGSASLPQVKAVMELLDTKFQEATDAAGDLNLTHAQTKYHLGGADWLVKLKAEIQALTETARETAKAGTGH